MGLFARTPSIETTALAERLAERNVYVLDVRRPSEWRRGHIRGSQNLPLLQVKRRLDTLPPDKTIVTVCAGGHRSNAAARTLRRAGYQVENLEGGMHDCRCRGGSGAAFGEGGRLRGDRETKAGSARR